MTKSYDLVYTVEVKKPLEQVTVHQAKTHLSKLLAKVGQGRSIIIKKGSRPVALLSPLAPMIETRAFGREKGRIVVSDDFESMPDSFLKHFKK